MAEVGVIEDLDLETRLPMRDDDFRRLLCRQEDQD